MLWERDAGAEGVGAGEGPWGADFKVHCLLESLGFLNSVNLPN